MAAFSWWRRTRHRFASARAPGEPTALAWSIAAVSLVLPFAALALGIAGLVQLRGGDAAGWWLIAAALAAFALDLAIDLGFAHPAIAATDEPDLNARGRQLIGTHGVVAEVIAGGRGKVCVRDTHWLAAGPDLAEGAPVVVVGVAGTVLVVQPV